MRLAVDRVTSMLLSRISTLDFWSMAVFNISKKHQKRRKEGEEKNIKREGKKEDVGEEESREGYQLAAPAGLGGCPSTARWKVACENWRRRRTKRR